MGRLTPAELRSRLAYDYEVMRGLEGPSLKSWRGFASGAQAAAGVEASPAQGTKGLVTFYEVDFAFPMLGAPGVPLPKATARFDLLAGGNYPSTPPLVQFISRPLPFCLRVASGGGIVCIGPGWSEAGGHMLLGQLIVHVMRLVNFDEPPGGDRGFSNGASEYWRSVLGGRPLNPALVYPTLAEETTHDLVLPAAPRVVPAEPEGFRPRRAALPSASPSPSPSTSGLSSFRPARVTVAFRPVGGRL